MSLDKREERDANRRRRVEIDQALHQLDSALAGFDEGIQDVVDVDEWLDPNVMKGWEPFAVLLKRKTVLDTLKKQSKENNDELNMAIQEIENRVKLIRALYPRKTRSSHGPAGDASYKEARLWLNMATVKFHALASAVLRNNRKKSGRDVYNGKCGRLGDGHVLSRSASEGTLVQSHRYHQAKLEKMRQLLDKERIAPEDVLSIQPDLDQCLYELDSTEGPCDMAEDHSIWDCVDLGSDSSDQDHDFPSEAVPKAVAAPETPTTPASSTAENLRRSSGGSSGSTPTTATKKKARGKHRKSEE
eukprot:TRINITY_DN2386_c1_g2_i1.p1 TRINITY_DN2386_c1_g2~~TRINITY_DN2386_c1_g2_i1.p1  ORF type:complete len:302 (+),score=39.66 TRINITY_DN2386_c1_g2_i1:245-1150(+)